MAYGIKYRLEYTGLGEYETRIDIKKEAYVGAIIEVMGSSNPFELTYEASEDYQFSKFKSSHCSLQLMETPALVADFREISNEDDYILEYYRDSVLMWSGYVMQEQYVEGDDISNPWLTLKFYDGISRLRVFTFNDLGLDEKATYSLSELFQAVDVLLYTNLSGTRGIHFNDFLKTTTNSDVNLLDAIYLQKASFFDKDGNAFNLYEILEDIASTFNFTYFLNKSRLAITNFEFSKNPKFIDYSDDKILKSFNQHLTLSDNVLFVNMSRETTYLDSLKKMEVFHEFDTELNYIDVSKVQTVTKTGSFAGAISPTNDGSKITFDSYATQLSPTDTGNTDRDYRKVSIKNSLPIKLTSEDPLSEIRPLHRLSFKVKFDFEYNVTNEMIRDTMNDENAQIARNRREELRSKSTFTVGLFIGNNDTHSYLGSNISTQIWLNNSFGNPRLEVYHINLGRDIDLYEAGVNYELSFVSLEGMNSLTFEFMQPNIHIDSLSAGNTHNYTSVKMNIEGIKLERLNSIGLKEIREEGVTDRNVFNYNLNRDKEFGYIDREEISYIYSLVDSAFQALPIDSFSRRIKTYGSNRIETHSVASFLLNQSLEQFGVQQQKVTGELWVKGNTYFDILTSIGIGDKDYAIHKFILNDYDSIYSIDLVEIK